MGFKDALERDLANVFFNTDSGFAEKVDIDGENITVIIDEESLTNYNSKNGEGLITDGLLFHVKVNDLPFEPQPGQNLMFNGEFYYISDVKKPLGMYSISLEVRDS
ncbi:hypothetical protein LG296_01650 [Ureibacillus chungkukjangi]|uniref:hypothetical protein n=1 Tax=Ureibacillus chungkukjangi TaxID=1202712 RepID=UPI00384A85B4